MVTSKETSIRAYFSETANDVTECRHTKEFNYRWAQRRQERGVLKIAATCSAKSDMFAERRNVKMPWRCTHDWHCLKMLADPTLVQPLNSTPTNFAALLRNKSLFHVRSGGKILGWTYSLFTICAVPQWMSLRQGNCNYFHRNLFLRPTWWTTVPGILKQQIPPTMVTLKLLWIHIWRVNSSCSKLIRLVFLGNAIHCGKLLCVFVQKPTTGSVKAIKGFLSKQFENFHWNFIFPVIFSTSAIDGIHKKEKLGISLLNLKKNLPQPSPESFQKLFLQSGLFCLLIQWLGTLPRRLDPLKWFRYSSWTRIDPFSVSACFHLSTEKGTVEIGRKKSEFTLISIFLSLSCVVKYRWWK